MRRFVPVASLVFLTLILACYPREAKSDRSFDDIKAMVDGMSTEEIQEVLGKPDSQMPMIGPGECWTWWNYTYLDGPNYPPEKRGTVVHLQIIFDLYGQEAEASILPSTKAGHSMTISYILPDKL